MYQMLIRMIYRQLMALVGCTMIEKFTTENISYKFNFKTASEFICWQTHTIQFQKPFQTAL